MLSTSLPKKPAATNELAQAIRAAAQTGEQIRLTGSNSLPLIRLDPASLAAMHKIRHALVGDSDAMNPFNSLPRNGAHIDLLRP